MRSSITRLWAGTSLLALLVLSAGYARATILLFDQERDAATRTIVGPAGSGGRVPDDYGDRVIGPVMAVPGGFFTYGDGGEGFTPDVTVDIFSTNASAFDSGVRLWQIGYGDLVNAVFSEGPGTAGSPVLYVRLSAAPGFVVDLYGFDLAGFGQDYTIAGVSVLEGTTALFSATNVLVEGNASGPLHTSFDFATPLSAQQLLVQIDLSNLASSIQDNVAIDNVRFGQTPPGVIPEPGMVVLLIAGLAWIAALRLRTRAHSQHAIRRSEQTTGSPAVGSGRPLRPNGGLET